MEAASRSTPCAGPFDDEGDLDERESSLNFAGVPRVAERAPHSTMSAVRKRRAATSVIASSPQLSARGRCARR